jgi:alpha-amylase
MAHAYALILLRATPAYPCVFYGDLYGIEGPKSRPPACGGKLPKLILARKLWAYGGMEEYLDDPLCIGA